MKASGALCGFLLCFGLLLGPVRGAESNRIVNSSKVRAVMIPCTNEDPEGLVGAPPPRLKGKPLTPEAQIDFENVSDWTMEIQGNLSASFCRSREQQLGGKYVGKLAYTSAKGGRGGVVLRPPKPVPLPAGSDGVQIWCYGDERGGNGRVSVGIVEDGEKRTVRLRPISWPYWSIAHQRLDRPIGPGAKLIEIRIGDLSPNAGSKRKLFLDELAFHVAPKEKVDLSIPDLPCPTRPETILPSFKSEYRNGATRQGDAFILTYDGKDERIEYRYRPRTGTLNDLDVTIGDDLNFQPAAGGGPVLAFGDEEYRAGEDARLRADLIGCELKGDAVHAEWRYRAGGNSATISMVFRLIGKSLILTVDEPGGQVSKWIFGKPAGGDTAREIMVPYLSLSRNATMPGVHLINEKAFVFCQPDWYVTNASTFDSPRQPEWHTVHPSKFKEAGCGYMPPFGGKRVALHERIFLTVSSDFQEVLPTIDNPKSPYAKRIGEALYLDMPFAWRRKECLVLLRELKRLGMDRCVVKHHCDTWSSTGGSRGNEPFCNTSIIASNIPGGEAGHAEYVRQVKELGYEYIFYTTYWANAPVNDSFDPGLVALDPDGQWIYNWEQYRLVHPYAAAATAARIAPEIEAKYGSTGSYCDVHTAQVPWWYVDYDPRKPGAAMLRTVFEGYCQVFQAERAAYKGPVVSEGHGYWYYAGMTDGNYAQLGGKEPWKLPFLVDFDLLKIHPLEVDIGMGFRNNYGYDKQARDPNDALDRFLCASIAYGHSAMRYGRWAPDGYWHYDGYWHGWTPPDGREVKGRKTLDPNDPLMQKKRVVVRNYFMMQQLASRYALEPVRSIAYFDGEKLVDTSEAIRSGALDRSQVAVEYQNGLRVFANGSLEHAWKVEADGKTYELPPNGWLAIQGRDFLEYSAIRNGHRVDYVRSPVYTFADGRGKLTDFGGVKAANAVIVLHNRNDERHEIDTPMDW